MASAWSQLDQLLTCAICLDRYRNPKLLPCQHTFCMDPCLEGLIDYARRQIKCPECRAEHRIPYQGVQAFPTNVTLMRFLELHRDITGEEPEPPPSMMERCSVCSEKSYLDRCAHCDKKICQDCREAHVDILRREINRINNQVRRGLHRLSDSLTQAKKNSEKLQHNCGHVKAEIEELVRRYTKDLRDTENKLKLDLEVYLKNELRTVNKLKDDLELEVSNISSNCELVDKYINEESEWTDSELVEYKEIFLKTLDFLRNFDDDTSDFARRIKFQPRADPDVLHRTLVEFGELKINAPAVPTAQLMPPPSNALMRSQSDHRLAAQFQRRQENRSYIGFSGHASDSEREARDSGSSSQLLSRGRREFGGESGYRRYGDRGTTRDLDYPERETRGSRFLRDDGLLSSRWRDSDSDSSYRSRYSRDAPDDVDTEPSHTRTVRFEEPPQPVHRERVLETDDATKGPLSGVIRLLDSPHVMERLHQNEVRQKQTDKEKAPESPPIVPSPPQPPPRRPPSRQLSEDEIDKQKKQNQVSSTTTNTTTTTPVSKARAPSPPPVLVAQSSTESRSSPRVPKEEDVSSKTSKPSDLSQRLQGQSNSVSPESTESQGSVQEEGPEAPYRSRRRRSSATENDLPEPPRRPESPRPQVTRSTRPPLGKSLSLEHQDEGASLDKKKGEESQPTQSSFYSRLMSQRRAADTEIHNEQQEDESEDDEEEDEESEEEDDDDEEEEDEEEDKLVVPQESIQPSQEQQQNAEEEDEEEEDEAEEESETDMSTSSSSSNGSESAVPNQRNSLGPEPPVVNSFSNRNERKNNLDYQRDHTPSPRFHRSTSKEEPRNHYMNNKDEEKRMDRGSPLDRRKPQVDDDDLPAFSRYLARNRNGRDPSPEERSKHHNDSNHGRREWISRSNSSHTMGLPEDSPEDESPPSSYTNSRSSDNALSRSRSHHALKSRDNSPEDVPPPINGNSNSWARYLRNKYGNGGSKAVTRSRSSHSLYTRSASESSDEEGISGRGQDSILSRYGDNYSFGSPRSMYLQKKRMSMKIGRRGTEPGCFTWPRGVAVGPDNSIVVADSSNHRVQVFDSNGKFLHEFGTYGSAEGEFDCLAGVVVNRIGQYIISDRYNHRIQVFDPSGRFLRSFGCEGRTDGRLSYPWGITTDSLGFIYVCDKENHRIQVFQSDGTFVGKFGSIGSRPGQLEHPHYIAVSNTNRVIVSDSNNHRIQIFDVNGRSLSTFGTEGSDDGQFKFPRGIAVDDQGYIIVGDSGNNRVQIFHPDGTFLKAFGTWGPGEAEFKGLEGISVMSNGNILVCDRENHRIQIF